MLHQDSALVYRDNKIIFGKEYFSHYFRKKSPAFHLQILKESSKNLNIAIQAPRGSAKSTVETFLDTIHGITYKKERFIIIVQNTYAKASASLNNIKFEYRDNEKLKEDYGISMDRKDAEGDTIFSHPDGFSVRVLCKGADQLGSIRGERFGAYRPTLILVDDLEDDEMVRNPERRLELEKQFNEVLNYAGEAGETRIVVIGTILHDDSLMAKLLSKERYKRFKKIFYRARTSGESLWPEKWTIADLKIMEDEDPEGFAKEMQGDPSSGSLETIRRCDFRYWDIIENQALLYDDRGQIISRWNLKDCKAAIANDMAWENKKSSDFAAIVPGLCTPNNDILIDHYINKRGLRPDELETLMFDMSDKYEALTGKRVQIGFEKAKLEKVMIWFLQEAMKRRKKWLWTTNINWGTKDKIERIMMRVANRYAQHSIYHRRGMGELENQLIRLRSVAHDDIADCVGMLPEMLAFAPNIIKKPQVEDKFKFLQRQTSMWRERNRQPYIFGRKTKGFLLPTRPAI